MTFKTEEEARKSWCPMARSYRVDGEKPVATNRDFDGVPDGGCKCIASECMAWRWGPKMSVKDGVIFAGDVHGGKRLEVGFCGAFGRPNQAE